MTTVVSVGEAAMQSLTKVLLTAVGSSAAESESLAHR